jgi:flotillin
MGTLLAILVLLGCGALLVLVLVLGLKNLYYVCQPSEVLVFSGRTHASASGGEVGYRVIRGGSALRVPLIETVDRVDLTNMIIDVVVKNAYSKGGIPLTVQGVANVKIPGELPLLHNALERFLGRSREEVMRVARETLEGNLRGVLATLTPEQVNRDKEAFTAKLTEESGHDLNRLGLVLDTLKIQNVSDEVGYLDAIGRTRSAQVRRNAQIAEAEAQAGTAEVKWRNYMAGEVAKLTAAIEVARKDNDRRVADATTRREALIAEQVAEVQAMTAQAAAEIKMQAARIDQVRLRLEADVVQPAEAQKEQAIARAKAEASKIIEQGKATAQVLTELAQTYRSTGGTGRDVLLMQKLVPVLEQVTGTIGTLKVDRLTVLGRDAGADSNGAAGLARGLVSTNEQVKAALGVDVAKVLRDKLGEAGGAATNGASSEDAPAASPKKPQRFTRPAPQD